MNKNKKIIISILLILLFAGASTIYYFSSKSNSEAICKNVIFNISYTTEKPMITEADIYNYLKIKERKKYFLNKQLNKIEIKKIESELKKMPEIKTADIYFNISNNIVFEIQLRTPILRVVNPSGKDYYLCDDLKKINISRHFSPYITPVSGYVNAKIDKKLYTLVRFVNNNSFWNDQIQQYFVSENADISFIPTTGVHEVILGSTDNLKEKFKKLEIFYQKGLNKVGWEKYKTINLKFKGQVICK
ncbi:MAG: hypothetical protein IT243_08375 [Bacteroidia bacterium]|nr:hypothetical protein [Bacteroidia bacterium]